MTPVLELLSPVLSQQEPPPNAPEFGGSSPIGLVVIVLLFIAMFFLIRSMNTHLRKVPASFDQPDEAATAAQTRDEASPDGAGQDAAGHDAVGHDAVGHDAVGHDAVGHDAAGQDGAPVSDPVGEKEHRDTQT
jgi:hypothetical protein